MTRYYNIKNISAECLSLNAFYVQLKIMKNMYIFRIKSTEYTLKYINNAQTDVHVCVILPVTFAYCYLLW